MKKLLIMIITIFMYVNMDVSAYTMTYLYGGTSVTYSKYIEKTNNVLNTISPDYFVITADGNLSVSKIDSRFIDEMHHLGIQVKPFLSNNWDKPSGIAALNNSENITNQIAETVIANHLDGVDVDIQNVSHLYKDAYTNFVKLLKEKMPDKKITVSVAANPNGWTQGWHGSYDYKKLAEYSDYLMIMAYDESFYGSDPGPVASQQFIERAIQYALKYTTPDKLVLGMPFYGRYWTAGKGGNAITAKDVESLINNYNAVKIYDESMESSKVTLTIGANDTKPTLWGGRVLGAGDYEIWYDDLRSLEYKMDLAKKYHLKGTGSWALGQENTDVWPLYAIKNGEAEENPIEEIPIENLEPTPTPNAEHPFTDIDDHWAKDSIVIINDNRWMVGNGNGKFLPENALTRAECARIIMTIVQLEEIENWTDYRFLDTSDHWANKDIAIARYYGFLRGREDNKFYPDEYISREEFAVIIDRTFRLATSVNFDENIFSDVDRHSWSYNSITILTENKIIKGYDDGTFKPTKNVKRAEVANVLAKLIGYGINTPEIEKSRKLQLPR